MWWWVDGRSGRRDAGGLNERVSEDGKVWLAESKVDGVSGRVRERVCLGRGRSSGVGDDDRVDTEVAVAVVVCVKVKWGGVCGAHVGRRLLLAAAIALACLCAGW